MLQNESIETSKVRNDPCPNLGSPGGVGPICSNMLSSAVVATMNRTRALVLTVTVIACGHIAREGVAGGNSTSTLLDNGDMALFKGLVSDTCTVSRRQKEQNIRTYVHVRICTHVPYLHACTHTCMQHICMHARKRSDDLLRHVVDAISSQRAEMHKERVARHRSGVKKPSTHHGLSHRSMAGLLKGQS